MSTLATPLRRQLESASKQAHRIADAGARHALEALAVHEPDPYRHMSEEQRLLRRKLRAQARQLGDGESRSKPGAYEIKHLAEKLAYDQWHRILFARFLLENDLLISPEHCVSVSMDDCKELASSLGLKDAWAVAARFAAQELPEIFRSDDPAGAVELSINDRKPLIDLVISLPKDVFTATDSLGWCYQFWQAEKKDEVNASGNKIGADELPSVTQLFTEDYMVDFLLDNTLGAWHAGKVLESKPSLAATAKDETELRAAVALPGCPWIYLRFVQEDGKWCPAAGTFDGWPKTVNELKCLDPCMGSGHFVVSMFERLVALRVAEEGLDESQAISAVIGENLFGLELDPRCTQIGAFNLALAAWRRGGHCALPAMNIACCGLAPNAKKEDWLKLAGDDDRLQRGMGRLYSLFKDAPELGSLINPRVSDGDLLEAEFHELQPLLEKALAHEVKDDAKHEMAVTARGVAKAAEILVGKFSLVATNVPYLGRRKQDEVLKKYCENLYPESKSDLATCFLERCTEFCNLNCTTALVMPNTWLFLGTYTSLRKKLLSNVQFNAIARLGSGAFETINGEVVSATLIQITKKIPTTDHSIISIDVSNTSTVADKAKNLQRVEPRILIQRNQLVNPDSCIQTEERTDNFPLLSNYAHSLQGCGLADIVIYRKLFWELIKFDNGWVPHQSSPNGVEAYSGMHFAAKWDDGKGELAKSPEARIQGRPAWGKNGIACAWLGRLPAGLYLGTLFDNSVAAIIPKDVTNLIAIWCFVFSPEFLKEIRKINQKAQVANATLVKVPFDLQHWQMVAAEKYPNGLPKPFSSDPTQWLFNGHPNKSDQPLHVAVARLLAYRWPRQTGSSFPNCPALGPDGLEIFADNDGIVCLSATKGEAPAAERLRSLLATALGSFELQTLLAAAGPGGSKSENLDMWLRDEFFEQHCVLFHNRPFIWHIWDGHKNGFSALVNYHQLTHAKLQNLTYSYLGDWIRRQQASVDVGEAGSDSRLAAAKQLQDRLELILAGEPPFDLFVRWKPLAQQAVGWHPDLNDGVRTNIRPFLAQDIPGGKKGAGILRSKPNIKWEKDRGKEPVRDKKEFPWFWGWDGEKEDFEGLGKEPDGNRWNDLHYSNEFKNKARLASKAR
jgi:hypothetical protein